MTSEYDGLGNIPDGLRPHTSDPYHYTHICRLRVSTLIEVQSYLLTIGKAFTAYTTNVNLGSPAKVYDLLIQAAKDHPVSGNAEGSYLTMRSQEGAIFFVINIVGNFG